MHTIKKKKEKKALLCKRFRADLHEQLYFFNLLQPWKGPNSVHTFKTMRPLEGIHPIHHIQDYRWHIKPEIVHCTGHSAMKYLSLVWKNNEKQCCCNKARKSISLGLHKYRVRALFFYLLKEARSLASRRAQLHSTGSHGENRWPLPVVISDPLRFPLALAHASSVAAYPRALRTFFLVK